MATGLHHTLRRYRRQAGRGRRLPPAWFMTDEARTTNVAAAVAALPAGVGVILRHYRVPGRAALARRIATMCRRAGRPLLIAGDAELARAVGADGVHWPRWAAAHRRHRAGLRLATAAVHCRSDIGRARRLGVDAVLISPVFATASHPGAPTLGVAGLKRLAGAARRPVYALGGVTDATARQLKRVKLAGIAAIGGFSPAT